MLTSLMQERLRRNTANTATLIPACNPKQVPAADKAAEPEIGSFGSPEGGTKLLGLRPTREGAGWTAAACSPYPDTTSRPHVMPVGPIPLPISGSVETTRQDAPGANLLRWRRHGAQHQQLPPYEAPGETYNHKISPAVSPLLVFAG
ncbi:Hypothetical predicted protein [Pelobates cultripes]|uniref:Uncharacterized protein n=1 Tax=Pelobates cultripes TaxID=61616 RepID=A0AAD1R4M4_PELCU|nr:Hypothetical predicted protein [Pelobates cultripes]